MAKGSIISKIFAVVVSKFLTFTLFPTLMRNNPNLSH
ncbi:pilus assembly protein [Escherichia coli MP1]|nr:pilus assembly protein [Escherichia coli]EWY54589.1 pilus assembly protein [Escherichia coli MP1]